MFLSRFNRNREIERESTIRRGCVSNPRVLKSEQPKIKMVERKETE